MNPQTPALDPYSDEVMRQRKPGEQPPETAARLRKEAAASALLPEPSDAIAEKRQQAAAILREAEAAESERTQIASAWNASVATWKAALNTARTASEKLAGTERFIAEKREALFTEDMILSPLSNIAGVAEAIIGYEQALPLLREVVAHWEKKAAEAFAALREMTERHDVPREVWPPGLRR
jgi:hypothetical protein